MGDGIQNIPTDPPGPITGPAWEQAGSYGIISAAIMVWQELLFGWGSAGINPGRPDPLPGAASGKGNGGNRR